MSDKTLTQKAEAERMQKATEMFANHAIASHSVDGDFGRWLLRNPKDSENWCEIVELAVGHLIVHGDIVLVIDQRANVEAAFRDCQDADQRIVKDAHSRLPSERSSSSVNRACAFHTPRSLNEPTP